MGRRIGAYVIDAFITTLLLVVLFTAMADRSSKQGTVFEGNTVCPTVRATTNRHFCFEDTNTVYTLTNRQALVVFGLPFLVSFANLVLLQSAGGASIGKHILGLRVVDGNGNPANIGRA